MSSGILAGCQAILILLGQWEDSTRETIVPIVCREGTGLQGCIFRFSFEDCQGVSKECDTLGDSISEPVEISRGKIISLLLSIRTVLKWYFKLFSLFWWYNSQLPKSDL